jgi:hypothetical protein
MLRSHSTLWTLARTRRLPTSFRFLALPPSSTSADPANTSSSSQSAPGDTLGAEKSAAPAISLGPPPLSKGSSIQTNDALFAELEGSPAAYSIPTSDVSASSSSSTSSASVTRRATVDGDGLRSSATVRAGPEPSPLPHETPTVPLADIRARLQTWSEQTKAQLRTRTNAATASALTTFQQLGGRLNQLSGYEEIEELKRLVSKQGFVRSIRLTRRLF